MDRDDGLITGIVIGAILDALVTGDGGWIQSIPVAVAGAVLLPWIVRLPRGRGDPRRVTSRRTRT